MRILVYPHELGIGGSQLNAVELAAAVRDLGHEVVVFGRPGALVSRIQELGLEFIEAPPPGLRPSWVTAGALADIVERRHIDVLHGYEWPPALDAVIAARRSSAVTVATVMSMSVPPFIPRSVRLVVGTQEIADAEERAGRHRVDVIEPPVDLAHNDVDTDAGARAFRRELGIDDGRILVVSVARLAHELKLEGTLAAVEAIGRLTTIAPASLVLVGDGPARAEVEQAARAANERYGPGTVIVAGQREDPRAAYAAADVALGMGGSALRALAYGKPLVVQGESGFWRTLSPETLDQFLWTGWYGIGDGAQTGPAAFERELAPLLADPALRHKLGDFGLETVRARFSLDRAARLQVDVYEAALHDRAAGRAPAEVAALGRYARYYARKRVRRLVRTEATDDFNSRPVTLRNKDAADGVDRVFWFPGVRSEEVAGTDHRMVEALSQQRHVTWIDPPNRSGWRGWLRATPARPDGPGGITRVRVPAPIGVTRAPMRPVSRLLQRITFARAAGRVSGATVVVANPLTLFPRGHGFTKILYITDDWVAGAASLMTLSPRAVRRILARNLAVADAVAVVSPELLEQPGVVRAGRPTVVVPNGSSDPEADGPSVDRVNEAVVMGQLNERLDLALLEALADAGIRVRLVGPRTDRDEAFVRRLDALIAHPDVDWRGPVPRAEVREHLTEVGVGLTPYADTPFNRASSPLKTFEYLAAGLTVVSSDLPVSRWLATEHVRVAATREEFVEAVADSLRTRNDGEAAAARQALAREHSWAHRADDMLRLIDEVRAPQGR